MALVDKVKQLAQEHGCTPGQFALAWVMAQDPHIVPIPGTKRIRYLEDNAGAAGVTLSRQDLQQLDALFPPGAAAGARYTEAVMKMLNG